jgi:hypothetical protein
MIITNTIQTFLTSIRWTFIEAIVYQLVLVAHHIVVFRTVSPALFGMSSTIFSLLYLIIAIANFGFDHTLSSFFISASQSKKNFNHLIQRQLLFSICIMLIVASYFLYMQTMVSFACASILAALYIVESMRKSLASLLHVALYNKPIAFIEIGALLGYITIIWTCFYSGIPFSLSLIFTPLLITSFISLVLYFYYTYLLYCQLPDDSLTTPHRYTCIIQNRTYTWINQLSHLFFSTNFLVPFFAYHYGLAYAGLFKIISTLSYSLSSILRKIAGSTSSALFAHHKHTDNHQPHFTLATSVIHQLLYGIIIFFSINYHKILGATSMPLSSSHLIMAYFFLLITISESFFITYETFLITHEKTHYLALFNCSIMIMLFIFLPTIQYTAPVTTLIMLLIVRMLTFASIYWYSHYRWKIKPSWHINIAPQLLVLVTSLLFFIFV